MILLALRTGLRQGELLGLGWSDLDLPHKRLVVRQAVARGIVGTPKNGKTRVLPYPVYPAETTMAQNQLIMIRQLMTHQSGIAEIQERTTTGNASHGAGKLRRFDSLGPEPSIEAHGRIANE